MHHLRRLLDWQFFVALAAAPLFWLVLYLVFREPIDLGWPLRNPWLFMLPALVYPVLEEIVFRGMIQGWLLARLPGRRAGPVSMANLMTSVLFAAAHAGTRLSVWAASVFVPSLVFGHFRERHGSLLSPFLLHVFYNAGYFWLFAPPVT